MKDTILEKLACPVCASRDKSDSPLKPASDGKSDEAPTLSCSDCQSRFAPVDNIINLAGAVATPKFDSVQWAMEFRPLVAVYDRIWRPYFTYILCDFAWELEMSQQLMAVLPGMDVLDLGCGTGNFTRFFSDSAKPGTVIGVDLSLPMLKKGMRKLSMQRNTNITLMRGDVMKWPFATETFDRIHCAGSLHLFQDVQNVFRSIYRSLKKGGYFVASTYCLGGNALVQAIQNHLARTNGVHWFDQQELQKLSSQAGFTGWERHSYRRGIVFKINKPLEQ
jgi:SAM-dependent methyltransferase